MRRDTRLTLFERLAIALVSAILGLLTSAIVWVVVAINVGNTTAHTASFLFAPVVLGVAGFLSGEAFADVIGVWFQGMWALGEGWTGNTDSDHLGSEPFRPIKASLFLLAVVAITVWLSLA